METETKKEKKLRSRLYPRYNLEDCIKFIGTLSKLGGNSVSEGAIAADLGQAVNNSAFIGKTSSSKQFGLISKDEGKLSLTSLGKEIMFPREEQDKGNAVKKAFANPSLYKELIEAFNGKILPDYVALGNRLVHDHSIETAAKDIASKNFIRSAEYSGVMQNGIIVMDASALNSIENQSDPTDGLKVTEPKKNIAEVSSKNSGEQFIFEFAGGIKLVIPRNEKTSEAIIDGELKEARKALSDFSEKFVAEEISSQSNK